MPTVVIVCDHAHVSGGLAKVALTSAVGLAGRGHRVILFAAVGPVAPDLTAAGVEVVCLGQGDLLGSANRAEVAVRGIWNRLAAARLTGLLALLPKGDAVVHIHGWAKALSPSVVHAAHRSGHPVLFTLHDYFALCPNGAFFDFRRGRNCELTGNSPACLATHCDARAYPHKLWRSARHAVGAMSGALTTGMTLIYLSPRQLDVIRPHLSADAPLVHVPNPVDATDQGPAPVTDSRTVLYVGRLSREKGVVPMAVAAARAGVPVRFVGEGGEADAIRAANPKAELSGWLPAEGVAAAIRGARALVLPSVWYETFGLVVYEALAAGVPVIVSDNTAAADAVNDGKTGFVFRSGDTADLARAMVALDRAEAARRMGAEAYRRYWSAPFTLDRHLDRLEDVYEAALHRRAVPAAGATALGQAFPAGERVG